MPSPVQEWTEGWSDEDEHKGWEGGCTEKERRGGDQWEDGKGKHP